MQEAISAYASATLQVEKWQMWQLVCGIGKSRIIHSIGLMLLSLKDFKAVHIVIPNKALLKRDKKDFADYWCLGSLEGRVHYHEDLNFRHGKSDVLLIDEADQLVFADPLLLRKALRQSSAIGFTATPPTTGQQTLEIKIYEHLGFKLREYWPQALMRPENSRLVKNVDPKYADDLAAFVEERAKHRAVLIYTSEKTASTLLGLITDSQRVSEATELRRLDVRPNSTSHKVLVATESQVMRGFDYLGGHKGICLIVDRGFACQREADQALARVGRQGEMCERYITAGTDLLDSALNRQLLKLLISFERKFATSTQIQQPNDLKKSGEK